MDEREQAATLERIAALEAELAAVNHMITMGVNLISTIVNQWTDAVIQVRAGLDELRAWADLGFDPSEEWTPEDN